MVIWFSQKYCTLFMLVAIIRPNVAQSDIDKITGCITIWKTSNKNFTIEFDDGVFTIIYYF